MTGSTLSGEPAKGCGARYGPEQLVTGCIQPLDRSFSLFIVINSSGQVRLVSGKLHGLFLQIDAFLFQVVQE